eukprot:GHVH01016882.1.p1 GENE.GHVH01016882.1~~GHVH01016882.1.p1  ORF type:complete len:181 (+),score=12.92 GHVH01016882.1:86-628(+)
MSKFTGSSYTDVYAIVSQLGAGGYGQVFMGVNKMNGNKVAIKKYDTDAAGGLDKSILREITTSLSCRSNPFIKQISDLGFHNGVPWVAFDCQDYHLMEYIDKLNNNVPFRIIKVIIFQILQGLSILHHNGMMHRDIKPENIFVSGLDFPVIKIGDLGHARGTLAMDCMGLGYLTATRSAH